VYLIGGVVGGCVTATEILDNPVPFLIGSLLVLTPGLVLLGRFLRRYPLPSEAQLNGDPGANERVS
jgi:hypothetical protein